MKAEYHQVAASTAAMDPSLRWDDNFSAFS
jgi:hypothetical protein